MGPEIHRSEPAQRKITLEGFDLMHPEKATLEQIAYFNELSESIGLKIGLADGNTEEDCYEGGTEFTPAEIDLMRCRSQLEDKRTELRDGEQILNAVIDHKNGVNGLSVITEINWEANAQTPPYLPIV